MIPQTGDDLRQDFEFETLPSRTFRMNHNSLTIIGTIDQIQAVEQAVYLILNTERYEWLIHSWNYGVELHNLIGQDVEWLKSQSTYQLQKSKKETHEEPPLKLQCPKNGKYYSFQEIQAFYGISRPTLDSWVLKEGIPTMKLGRVKRIQKEAFDEVLKSKRKVEEDV